MAILKPNISPTVKFTETDLTFTSQNFGITSLGIAGEFPKGRAFDPIEIKDFTTFKKCFGELDACTFPDSQQPIYEGSYIAQQYLKESNTLFVSRVLGLSGYDAGDAWCITLGAALDPSTITTTNTSNFTATIKYAGGAVSNVAFSNTLLQELYDKGEIASTLLGSSSLTTGSTVSVANTFIGNCETFEGARFTMTLLTSDETYICITGSTTINSEVLVTSETQNCVIDYSGGTISTDSTFIITVENSIVLQNLTTNELTLIPQGILTLVGGTITHTSETSLTISDGTIYLPNGDVLSGGEYQICSFNGNTAVYNCETFNGINYAVTTGTTVITTPVTSGTTQLVVSQIPSGLIEQTFSGTVIEMSGTPYALYDNSVVAMFRSFAEYDGDEILNFKVEGNVINLEATNTCPIKPLDSFLIKGTTTSGESFEYNVSLDRTKKNYILRVFQQFIPCCPSLTPLYIEESFINYFEYLLNNNLLYCIKPQMCYTQSLDDYKEPYQGATTPWIVSELRGNRMFRLFRFHTFSDGQAANRDIKVSITNIKPDAKTFDVEVRSFGDTDARPVILESFRNVTLRKQDNNYIARRIGTVDGDYILNSKYIMVELGSQCKDESFPSGFEGYPIRDYECAVAPKIFYKKEYANTDRVRQVYLGFSDTIGFDADLFNYLGKPSDPDLAFWTGTTKGYHLDVNASGATIDGVGTIYFETGNAEFQNEADLVGTDYEKIYARKFTMMVYGGFDGWDIHRKSRTNTDLYTVNGVQAQKGLTSGAFDVYSSPNINEGSTVVNSDYYAYLEAIRALSNRDSIRINLLATPNVNTTQNSNLVEDTIEMVENERCDTFYVVTTLDTDSSGLVLQPQDVVGAIDGLFDSNYTATYFPWGQFLDNANNVYVWLPATAEAMRIFALTDKVRRPWYAGAGKERGVTEFLQARKKLTESERDVLYEGRVNSLATFKEANNTSPVYIWGNRNLQIASSALDRINVRRLLLYTRRLIEDVAVTLLFEQNDEEVRRQFESLVNPLLANIRNERGIFDFRIVVDRSNESFNSNEMKAKIQLKPVRTLEYINVEFVLTPVGVSFTDN